LAIRRSCSELYYPEHFGPISIKCAFHGQVIYEFEGRRAAVDDSSYLLLNHGQHYSHSIQSRTEVESFCIYFRRGFVEEVWKSLTLPSERLMDSPFDDLPRVLLFDKVYPHDRVLTPLLMRLRRTIARGQTTPGRLEEYFHWLAGRLLRVHQNAYRETESVPALRTSTRVELYRRLHRAKDFMGSSFDQPLDLPTIAGAACLSPHHFLRLFKSVFGETPHQYLTRKRLEKAQHLLRQTDLSVTEICFAVGFESLGSFSALFHQRLGRSPQAFRYGF
jgi:AraC-like DNA-binding protein